MRKVLSTGPVKVDVSFEDGGKMLGASTNGFGTYTFEIRADGSLYGVGKGAEITQDGEMITWKGPGVGKFKPDGAISYRGILYFRTASQKLARLNNAAGVFEYEIDPKGKAHSKIWEWK